MKNLKRLFIVEKPSFNKIPSVWITTSKYCYLLPTGNGESKSMHELSYDSGYSGDKNDIYSAKAFMVTYMYTIFFLWFRLHFKVKQEKLSESMYSRFYHQSKSYKSFTDFI